MSNEIEARRERISRRKKRNGWKIAFITLVLLIAAAVAYIGIRLSLSAEYYDKTVSKSRTEQAVNDDGSLTFETKFNDKQFNEFLEKVLMPEDSPYDVYFKNQNVYFTGKIKVLSFGIPIEIKGVPNALKDGNIDIHITDIEAGSFNLPTGAVMKGFSMLIPKDIPMSVDSERNVINIDLLNIAQTEGIFIKAKEINPEKNEFIFEITMPDDILKRQP